MISKELLNEVLKDIRTEFEINYIYENKSVNVYELSHECKKWAIKNYYVLWSCIDSENGGICRINQLDKKEFYADTEPEAIFLATQWIKDNK